MSRQRLLVVSHVSPASGASGQSQRVAYTLRAARRRFHVTLLTVASDSDQAMQRTQLEEYCDELKLISPLSSEPLFRRMKHQTAAAAHAVCSGLKRSNYLIGQVLFTPERLAPLIADGGYDLVLFEYWHAWRAAQAFRHAGIPAVLDAHNVLWRSYERQLMKDGEHRLSWMSRKKLQKYRAAEESAWREFDALIAINREEYEEMRQVAPRQHVFYAPMGIDLSHWPYNWERRTPQRVAYYGGLASAHNQRSALQCVNEVMPLIWKYLPETEFWMIGSNPPESLKSLESDPRVHVTGFVGDVCGLLSTMSVVLCPWSGRYGFRSRVVEILAAGAPLIVSDDAVAGMELTQDNGIDIANTSAEFGRKSLALLSSPSLAAERSVAARRRCEELYDVRQTYDRLIEEVQAWFGAKSHEARSILT
jgi:glycosyltransferase involved in cell wall biosynthesis